MRWLLPAVVLAGCQHYEQLDPKLVQKLDLIGTTSDGRATRLVCARGALIDVYATTHDGKRHRAGNKDDISRNEFDPGLIALSASLGSFHDRAWNPPNDAVALLDVERFTVTAKLVANQQITGSVELVPTWACELPHVLVTGHDGGTGTTGDIGPGQSNGFDGGTGGHGGAAPATTILVGYTNRPNGQKLVIADITTSDGHNDLRAVFAPDQKLHISATGGTGGNGGNGGAGGASYDGGPQAGNGGRGGDGGDGGDGGAVTIEYDAASPELATMIVVDASGGNGGTGGAAGAGGAGPTDNAALTGGGGTGGDAGRAGHDGPAPVVRAKPGLTAELGELQPRDDAHDVAPDSARHYAGDLTTTIAGAAPHTESADLVSTRVEEYHFTMSLGEACKLELSRPPAPKQYHYTLDKSAACAIGDSVFTIDHATLDLDPPHDTLKIEASGSSIKPVGAFALKYLGKRK
ncbi:MAG TPA: hypothetical protein VH143_13330 [Kofleriaceae bacterium]|nr:hypothetical protein [Kofleriaceae bacterium]